MKVLRRRARYLIINVIDFWCVLVFSANDSDLGSDATPTLQAFYYFARSLEENMDATRKAVVVVPLAEYQALQNR